MKIKRALYLGYYLKQLDRPRFKLFLDHASKQTGTSKVALCSDVLGCVFKYNISMMDYFIFRFYEKDDNERNKWVGTGYKYEFDLKTNTKNTREILSNKLKFYEAYAPFINHAHCSIDDLEHDGEGEKAHAVLHNKSGKIVLKDSLGQCGWDVEIVEASDYTPQKLVDYMQSRGFDLAEAFIHQHEELNRLSPSGLNTVRMMTMINDDGGVDILGARMRISVNNFVDNLASGNIACPIDLETGKINGPGVYSDITKQPVTHHPITGIQLVGFQIPMWPQIMETTRKIALHRPENRGVGWDVALTVNGPDFLEGNHNWCKILWQIPVNKGLKHVLEGYNLS